MMTATLTQPTLAPVDLISYQVIHMTPGRIRFRVPKIAKHSSYAHKLERSLKAFPFVMNVVLNPKAMSVTVHYQPSQIAHTTIQEKIALAIQAAATPALAPHATSALANRLGVTVQSLNWHRSRIDFADWSQARDPKAVAWCYDAPSKLFHPSLSDSTDSTQESQSLVQSLGIAAGGKVGSMVGKFAGEAIGLMLLGSAGVIVGAEVGALVGEVVGAELGMMF